MTELLLGANPLSGVSHLSAEQARSLNSNLELTNKVEVVREAGLAGASGFTFTPSSSTLRLLDSLRGQPGLTPMSLFPVIPALDKYWNAFVSRGSYGLLNAVLTDLPWSKKATTLLHGGAAALTMDPESLLRTYINVEIAKIQKASPSGWQVDTVFLGETFTDALLSLRSYSLIRMFGKSIIDAGVKHWGLQTRNLAMLLRAYKLFAIDEKPTIMAPLNPVGFQMTPDRATCEKLLRDFKEIRLFAISVLAAGLVTPRDAIFYLETIRPKLSGIAVGTSSVGHARSLFPQLKEIFG